MSLTIDQFRAAVGRFNARVCIRRNTRVSFIPKWARMFLAVIFMIVFNGLFMKACSILSVLLLLFRCGDIEMNPGPIEDDANSIESDADSIIDSFFNNTFCKIIHLNVRSLLTCHEQI